MAFALAERELFRCPRCDYDVTQTLVDRIAICPECGLPISWDDCAREVEQLPWHIRKGAYLSWGLFFAWPALLITREPAVWGTGLALRIAGVYAGWLAVERWLRRGGSAKRAVLPALATMSLCFTLWCVLTLAWEIARAL